MKILGISAHYHDAAAALVVDGMPVAAVQEERLSRRKNDAAFPMAAIEWCLEQGGLEPDDLDAVVFYERPMLKFDRILTCALRAFPAFLALLPPCDEEHPGRKTVGARHHLVPTGRAAAESPVHRASPVSCRRRLPHRAGARGGHPHRRRRGRMGDPDRRTGQARTGWDRDHTCCGKSAFRIRWGCSTRPSPPISVSRSTKANTR